MTWLHEDPAGAQWVKARASHPVHMCVEVAQCRTGVAVRDSKAPDGPVLAFSREEFAVFLDGVKRGEFDHFVDVPSPRNASATS